AGGGTVAPGHSPGKLSTGNVALDPSSHMAVELNGTTVTTTYDQVGVTGTVNLGSAVLDVTLGYLPTAGDSYTIVNNDGTADAVVGTFAGHAEGTSFPVGTRTLKITY